MSLPNRIFGCTDCNKTGTWLSHQEKIVIYQLPSGSTYQTHAAMGWCNECDYLRPIEPSFERQKIISEIEALLPSVQSISYKIISFLSALVRQKSYKEELLAELESLAAALEVATLRNSHARRCLSCGSPNTTQFIEGLPHDLCGGKLVWKPNDPDAPRMSYTPLVTYVDIDGRKAKLPDSQAWASHLATHTTIESVMTNGIFSGFLIRVPLVKEEFDKLARRTDWLNKFVQIIELRVMHYDFDKFMSDEEIDQNPLLKTSISSAPRAGISSDIKAIAKWSKSQVRKD